MVQSDLHLPDLRQGASVTAQQRIDGGPSEAGTVTEHYPSGDLPWVLAHLIRDSVICEATGEPVKTDDPARLRVEPWPLA